MKVAAASQLKLDPAQRPGYVVLTAPWVVDLIDGRWLVTDEGFWCDGASVPKPLWGLLGADPLQLLPMGVAHDYAVREGATLISRSGYGSPFTLPESLDLALAVAAHYGVGKRDQRAIRLALSVAAGSYWPPRRGLKWRPTT